MFRLKSFSGDIEFNTLLREIVKQEIGISGIALDEFVEKKSNRLWNYFNKNQRKLISNSSCNPYYEIVSSKHKLIKSTCTTNPKGYSQLKLNRYKGRPNILEKIDELDSREYEALACQTVKLLGSKRFVLTPPGNEAGIDFIATINFGSDAHFLFGSNGPIRIIGQCKKYTSESQVNSIKEFNQTLLDVYSLTDKVKEFIPHWFRSSRGPIIGWMIAHSGFQSGAYDRAKNYGIICSDSKDIAELISTSRKYHPLLTQEERADLLKDSIQEILDQDIVAT
ncbi:restriction endonuclease [Christiangramia sp. ASW11-125]|uniref:restriction endonuclease n=1 Tax=Christiangramia sp. ASW11-125 TaxID=3400701 RepID=UPI003AB0AF2C